MQRVPRAVSGMNTVSTALPFPTSISHLRVPSADRWSLAIPGGWIVACASSTCLDQDPHVPLLHPLLHRSVFPFRRGRWLGSGRSTEGTPRRESCQRARPLDRPSHVGARCSLIYFLPGVRSARRLTVMLARSASLGRLGQVGVELAPMRGRLPKRESDMRKRELIRAAESMTL